MDIQKDRYVFICLLFKMRKINYLRGHGTYYLLYTSGAFSTIVPHFARKNLSYTYEVLNMYLTEFEEFTEGTGI